MKPRLFMIHSIPSLQRVQRKLRESTPSMRCLSILCKSTAAYRYAVKALCFKKPITGCWFRTRKIDEPADAGVPAFPGTSERRIGVEDGKPNFVMSANEMDEFFRPMTAFVSGS